MVHLQPPLPAALHVLHRWAPSVRVEAIAGSAPIQWVAPWDEPLEPRRAARYARLDSAPDAVHRLPRSGNRFAVDQTERVGELAAWLRASVAPRLPPRESLELAELLPYIAELLVTWVAVDPDVMLLEYPGETAVHLLHRTGDQTTRFSFVPCEEPLPTDPGAVAELLAFLLPVTVSEGVHLTTTTGEWDPAGLAPIERDELYLRLGRAVFAYGNAIAPPGQELGRLAARLLRDILGSAESRAGGAGEWYRAGLPVRPSFAAAGRPVRLAFRGSRRTAYIDAGYCIEGAASR